jgi:biotin carboxyl carrier protein
MFQIGRIIQGYKYPEETIKLNFPLHNGSYYVAHGGSNSAINHHVKSEAQRYALDIVKLDKLGWRAGGVYPQELSKYRIFGETIYSPIDGTVTEAIDGLPDLIPPLTDNQNVFGNYVAIEHQGVKVLLAHLQNGSVKVKVGDPIEAGQLLGKVGNSGHTSEPHLHVHAQRSSNGTGIPMLFADKFLKRNSLVTPTEP